MKNRKQCIQDTEDQTHEGMEGEENEESCSCSTLLYDGNTCPICLNCLLEQEIGFPENCTHTFCMTCILKWAEEIFNTATAVKCPVPAGLLPGSSSHNTLNILLFKKCEREYRFKKGT